MIQKTLILMAFTVTITVFAEVRVWTDNNGRRIQAELVQYEGGKVTLKRANGKSGTISYDQLSAADQTYLDNLTTEVDSAEAESTKTPSNPSLHRSAGGLPPFDSLKEMLYEHLIWIVGIAILNIPLIFLWGWFIFGSFGDFVECVKYHLTPDIISLFRGEWAEDAWGEMKLGFFVLWSIAIFVVQIVLFFRYLVPYLS